MKKKRKINMGRTELCKMGQHKFKNYDGELESFPILWCERLYCRKNSNDI